MQILERNLAGSYFLLAGLTSAILPLIQHLPWWTGLLCLALLGWRLLYEKNRLPLPGKVLTVLMVIAILFAVLYEHQTIVGRQAGATLLLSLICLKLLELKTLRDASNTIQLAFFAIMTGFLFDQSILTAMFMLLAVLLLFSALLTLHHQKANYTSTRLTEKTHLFTTSRIIVYALPLTLVMFLLFPRLNPALWALPEDAFSSTTGLSDEMSPGKISRLGDSNAVAFRVQFSGDAPVALERYWRGPVFWMFDGTGWSAPERKRPMLKSNPITQAGRKIDYTVTLEPHNKHWLFALDIPGEIPPDVQLTQDMQLLSYKPVQKLLKYQLTSYLQYHLPPQQEKELNLYRFVPANVAPKARKMIAELKAKHTKPADLIQAVLDHFGNGEFYYTRTPPLLFDDPIDEFLFGTKRGFCEHYASTFTVLMRLAGFPARVVTGYQGGEKNPLSNYMIVRQSDAHAWSEVYTPQQGWQRIDPTAAIPATHIEDPVEVVRRRPGLVDLSKYIDRNWLQKSLRQARFAMDMLNNQWNQWVVGYNQQRQKSFLASIGLPDIDWFDLGYLLAATLACFTGFFAWRILATQQTYRTPVQRIYQRFLKKSARAKFHKAESEGALSFAQRLAQQFPARRKELFTIAHAYNNLRYGQANPKTLEVLKHTIKQLRLQ